MKIKFLLASSAALALAACGDTTDEAATPDTMAEDTALTAEPMADPAMPTTAQEFATMQASSDAYEIEAGRIAQENGGDQAVKDFGALMVEDHTASTEKLKAAAGQAEGVTADPQMTAEQRTNLDALRNAGEDFDGIYLEQQVAAHEKALAMLRNYAENGDIQALKDFAGQTADVVEGHLERARDLHGQAQQM